MLIAVTTSGVGNAAKAALKSAAVAQTMTRIVAAERKLDGVVARGGGQDGFTARLMAKLGEARDRLLMIGTAPGCLVPGVADVTRAGGKSSGCEYALTVVDRIRRANPGQDFTPLQLFTELLRRTAGKGRDRLDSGMDEVIEALNKAMLERGEELSYRDWVTIRAQAPMAGRLAGRDWPAHHLLPRKWLKRLLKRAGVHENHLDGLNDRSPAILLPFDQHVKKDANGIHPILDSLQVDITNRNVPLRTIRERLLDAYGDFDSALADDAIRAIDRFMEREGLCGLAWDCVN